LIHQALAIHKVSK